MTEQHAKNLYRAFQTQGFRGTCDICGNSAMVFADIATMKYRCFECCVKRLVREEEERERERKKIPLDLKGFTEL